MGENNEGIPFSPLSFRAPCLWQIRLGGGKISFALHRANLRLVALVINHRQDRFSARLATGIRDVERSFALFFDLVKRYNAVRGSGRQVLLGNRNVSGRY